MASAVYQAAVRLIHDKYHMRGSRPMKGAWRRPWKVRSSFSTTPWNRSAPPGLQPGEDVCLAVDVAASHFWHDGRYCLGGQPLDSRQMIDRLWRAGSTAIRS